MQQMSPSKVAMVALAAASNVDLSPDLRVLMGGTLVSIEEAENTLSSLSKPTSCASAKEDDHLAISCRKPTGNELFVLGELRKLMNQGTTGIGLLIGLHPNARVRLRGAGIEGEVDPQVLKEWAESYVIQQDFGFGIKRLMEGTSEIHIVTFSALKSLKPGEFFRAIHRGG